MQPQRWDGNRLTEEPDGRIAFFSRTEEVFVARTVSEERARSPDLKPAEISGLRTVGYDLHALGPANQIGRPTAEGPVRIEFPYHRASLTRAAAMTWASFASAVPSRLGGAGS